MTTCATNRMVLALSVMMMLAARGPAWADGAAGTEGPVDPARVQAAVAGGLKWLADHQIKEGPDAGSWPQCGDYPTAVASLSGLALLANGHMPNRGAYSNEVARALVYVKASMTRDGYLGARGNSMYVHAICTLFGLSCLGTSQDPKDDRELAEWCRRSLKVIVAAQDVRKIEGEQGGWKYDPSDNRSDLSVTSWQMLALHAARQCGYPIDPACLERGLRYMESGRKDIGNGLSGFLYQPGPRGAGKEPEPGVSGAAVFIKSLVDPDADIGSACAYLRQFSPAWGGPQYAGYFYFVSFYLAQGMLQQGGEAWAAYSGALQKVLLEHQDGDGHWFFPEDNHRIESDAGVGPAYATAMAVLMLSLEKQYLPLYQRQMKLY